MKNHVFAKFGARTLLICLLAVIVSLVVSTSPLALAQDRLDPFSIEVRAPADALARRAGNEVFLAFNPPLSTTALGDTFTVTIEVQSGTQRIDGAEVHVNFNPSVLEVISLTAGSSLPIQIVAPTYNNTLGRIEYAAGKFAPGPFPSGTFDLLTIEFEAVASAPTTTDLQFSLVFPRKSEVTFNGRSVLTAAIDGSVELLEPDADGDGFVDTADNCPFVANPS